MNIRFIYKSNDQDIVREKISILICEFVSIMNESVYGNTMLNPRLKNRISINNKLTSTEIIEVLVHELIHLNQIKTGRLSSTSNGRYIWNKRQYTLNPNIDYDTLPWERDVVAKQKHILKQTLEYLSTTTL